MPQVKSYPAGLITEGQTTVTEPPALPVITVNGCCKRLVQNLVLIPDSVTVTQLNVLGKQ